MKLSDKVTPTFFCVGLLLLLIFVLFYRPTFSTVIASERLSIADLTPAEKTNLSQAAARLNGVVIHPRESFSFNYSVGPRTGQRGYAASPSYLGNATPDTTGGGICILSSLLYTLALKTGMKIIQRVPHLRPMLTIAPGYDATVWYGQADLQWRNTMSTPIQIEAHLTSPNEVEVAFKSTQKRTLSTLHRQIRTFPGGQTQVSVFEENAQGQMQLVSRDLYGALSFNKPVVRNADNH